MTIMIDKPDETPGQQLEPATHHATETGRGTVGEFVRTPAQAERDAEAARLRGRSMSYRAIADQLGVTVAAAHRMVQRALADIVREPAETVIALELAKLDTLEAVALRVLERHHVVVSNGQVVRLDGDPLVDDAPVLTAVDTLRKLGESRRKLLGADAAQKIDTTAQVKFVIEGVDTDAV